MDIMNLLANFIICQNLNNYTHTVSSVPGTLINVFLCKEHITNFQMIDNSKPHEGVSIIIFMLYSKYS